MEIDEVNAAMIIKAKKTKATRLPAAPIVSNNAGRTVKISESPAMSSPASV